jgi:hypothetical protein
MTHPSNDHRDPASGSPIEHDPHIVKGSMLAVAAFLVIAIGIVWYALTTERPRTASFKPPTAERSVPDGTTGYGGPRTKAPAPNPTEK